MFAISYLSDGKVVLCQINFDLNLASYSKISLLSHI